MRIMCIDDDVMSLKLLEQSIKSVVPSAKLLTFTSVVKALACMDNNYDIAFIAPEMKEIEAGSLVSKLRAINERINIVFVSNYSDYEHEAMRIHASGFQHKPITPAKVQFELNNLLYSISE